MAGCADSDPPALRTLVTVVSTQEGQPAVDATRRLVIEGRRSLVVIEAALHTADAPGRKRLVRAIAAIADEEGEGAALLDHLRKYDDDPAVRAEAEQTLRKWAAETTAPRRAASAQKLTAEK